MNRFVKTSISISATEVAVLLVALLRNKYLALRIGPEGLGMYGLLNSFFNVALVFSGTWLVTGATKYTAQFQKEGDLDSVRRVNSITASLAVFISVLTIAVLFFAKGFVIDHFLTREIPVLYYLLFLGAVFGLSLRPILTGVLQGLMAVRKVVTSRISISVFEVGTIVLLTYAWGLTGFFASILVSSLFAALFLWCQVGKSIGRFRLPRLHWDSVLKNLLQFGGVAFVLGFINLSSQYCEAAEKPPAVPGTPRPGFLFSPPGGRLTGGCPIRMPLLPTPPRLRAYLNRSSDSLPSLKAVLNPSRRPRRDQPGRSPASRPASGSP